MLSKHWLLNVGSPYIERLTVPPSRLIKAMRTARHSGCSRGAAAVFDHSRVTHWRPVNAPRPVGQQQPTRSHVAASPTVAAKPAAGKRGMPVARAIAETPSKSPAAGDVSVDFDNKGVRWTLAGLEQDLCNAA